MYSLLIVSLFLRLSDGVKFSETVTVLLSPVLLEVSSLLKKKEREVVGTKNGVSLSGQDKRE
jgi:hypothetical protein